MFDLQGMKVAWEDEESDVLLLRVDNGIPAGERAESAAGRVVGSCWKGRPHVQQDAGGFGCCTPALVLASTSPRLPAPTCAEFGTGALGWDVSGWAAADTEVATISHPRGDLKKVSRSTAGLRRAAYVAKAAQPSSGETHYRVGAAGRACLLCHPGLLCSAPACTALQRWCALVLKHFSLPSACPPTNHVRYVVRLLLRLLLQVQWTQGGSDTGSSGAPLVDVARGHVIGVLTGAGSAGWWSGGWVAGGWGLRTCRVLLRLHIGEAALPWHDLILVALRRTRPLTHYPGLW